ncbi:MAG: MFS transporter [Promicromonosporaceae bacterium]|nr:MFS transporter [Promicromonosporaceae bacterium]
MPTDSRSPLGSVFWRLWTASAFSNLADGILKIAVPLVAITLTESPLLIGGLSTLYLLPWLLFTLPVGALADRLDRRMIMLVANASRAMVVALLALAIGVGAGHIIALYAAAFLAGIAEVFHDTTAQTVIPQIVARPCLGKANARLYGAEIAANQFIGPPLGGLLVGVVTWIAVGLPAALWVVAVFVFASVKGSFRPAGAAAAEGKPRPMRTDIAEGMRYLFRHPLLRTMAMMTGVVNLAGSAAGAVFVLFAVGEHSPMGLSDAQFGMLATAAAVGAVLGSLLASHAARVLGRTMSISLAIATGVAHVLMPGLTAAVWPIVIVSVLSGIGIMTWNVILVSLRQAITPEHLFGRVNSCYRLFATGAAPLGALLGGVLGEAFGLRTVFIAAAAVTSLAAVGLVVVNERNIARYEPQPA